MTSTISLGTTKARVVNPVGGIGRNAPNAGEEDAPLLERGLTFTRGTVLLAGGIPTDYPNFGMLSQSVMTLGSVGAVYTGLHSNPLDVDLNLANRYQPLDAYFTPPGSAPNYALWAPAIGVQDAGVMISAANLAAHPTTGVVTDSDNQYWGRTDELTRNALIMDQNPIQIDIGTDLVQFTVVFAAIVYEVGWAVTDLIAMNDPDANDPEAATLMSLRMDGDELQLWLRGRQVFNEIITPAGLSLAVDQLFESRKPLLIAFSLDLSTNGPDAGVANLVVIDTKGQVSISANFSNQLTDESLGSGVFIGRAGSSNFLADVYNLLFVDALGRMDLMDLAFDPTQALAVEDLQTIAGKLDAVYGVTL